MRRKLAIDIGTTNIEYACLDSDTGELIMSQTVSNCNRTFGKDVMTRIHKANDGNLSSMTTHLRKQLHDDISRLCPDELTCINIAANTTMVHILMGIDCTNLAAYPFSPVHTERIEFDACEYGLTDTPVHTVICPGINAFIGGDIVSGLSTLPSHDVHDILFADLGTNAEMVYITRDSFYTASAAAGPAFETCSAGHGSDAVKALAYMLSNNIIDETGLLRDEFFESGYDCKGIHFSQHKIRDFQMAKSAIRTGLDILLADAPANSRNILLYIAGNFGQNLDVAAAKAIGMLPDIPFANIIALGNTSLRGAQSGFDFDTLPAVINNKKIEEIQLANHPDFNDLYINNLNF